MSHQIKVGILGQEYTIQTQADRAYAEKVGRYVASKCQEAQENLRSSSVATVALLAALNIASEYLQVKETYEELLTKIKSKEERLASLES